MQMEVQRSLGCNNDRQADANTCHLHPLRKKYPNVRRDHERQKIPGRETLGI
jgi:hypothetical protein